MTFNYKQLCIHTAAVLVAVALAVEKWVVLSGGGGMNRHFVRVA